jgi:hypothetical protein
MVAAIGGENTFNAGDKRSGCARRRVFIIDNERSGRRRIGM